MMPSRRGVLLGLAGVCAPVVIRTPGLLMPVRAFDQAYNDVQLAEFLREFNTLVQRSLREMLLYGIPNVAFDPPLDVHARACL